MNVLFDAQSIVKKRSGVGRYSFNLLKSLGALKGEHKIFPLYFNFRRRFKEQDILANLKNIESCEIRKIPGFIMNKLWDRFDIYPIENLIKKSIDIIHFPNFLMKPTKIKRKIITVHDVCFKRFPEFIEPYNYRKLTELFEKNLEASDAVITVSHFSKNEFLKYFPSYKKPVYVTYNGINDFCELAFNDEIKLNIKKKYDLEKDFFLFVGTIEPRKNLSFFLRIFKEILKENKNIEFVVIGDKGWLYDDFFETINKLDIEKHVRILGYVSKEDLPYIFNLAKLFVFPSLYEGFGLPPLESIMCNTASIVSKIPIMEEIFHDNVFYLDLNKSIKELKEELLSIFYDEVKKERMIKKGKELRNKFLWENTAFETLNIYKNLL